MNDNGPSSSLGDKSCKRKKKEKLWKLLHLSRINKNHCILLDTHALKVKLYEIKE